MLAPPLQRTAKPVPPERKTPAMGGRGEAVQPARAEQDELGPIIQRACAACEEDAPRWQAKYAVHPPGDRWEKEADGVAEAVVRGGAVPRLSPVDSGGLASGLQRLVNRPSTSAPRAGIQTSSSGAPDPVGNALRRPGPGSPLNPRQRARIETPLGADLRSVRVHTGPEAEAATASVNARAFTTGNHIWLGRGESAGDERLLAHEATHVVQQGAAAPAPPAPSRPQSTSRVQREPSPPGAVSGAAAGSPASTSAGTTSPSAPSTAAAPAGGSAAAPTPGQAPQSAAGGAAAAGGTAAPAAAVPAGVASPVDVGTGVELLMPEPPAGLSAADEARLAQSQQAAGSNASAQQSLPAAEDNVAGARAAVTEPETETTARASGALAEALGERPAPSPEIEALCERIREAIRARRPPDEDSLLESNPQAAAQAAGGELEASVRGDAQRVQGDYDALNQPARGTPQQQAQPLAPPPAAVPGPPIAASQSVPEAVPAADVSLDADVAASQERVDSAGMNSQPAQLVQSGPIAEARDAQSELTEAAQRDPAEVLAEQTATRAQASADMAALQEQALAAMQGARVETVTGVTGQQQGMVGSEEQMRAQVSAQAQAIFDSAQTRVNALLEPLPETAMHRWETGVQVLSTRFEQDLSRIEEWKRERYSGVGGALLELWEGVVGLPDEFIRAYDSAERNFGDGVCALIREISTEVNGVIAACEQIIDDARRQIGELFAGLPAGLQEWAAGEQARFSQQLDALQERAANARDEFNRNLAERAAQSVQQVRERIHELREAAGGLLGRIAGAVERFLEDPARFIIDGLLELVGIPPASFWVVVDRIGQVINDIADDPMGFANNLVSALGQGFQRFFDNFGQHIIGGFFDWLFSGLGAVGVQLPSDFSLKSLITFFLQLMGITWARIRQLLARHIGEENVALLERAYELIATLIEQGPAGIFEMIKEQLNPQNLIDQVVRAAVDFLIETLIVRVTARIIAMFNPAGAIIQAIEIIYRVLRWIFDNAARIFSLVETVVNGAADLIAGNLAGMAAAVEGALARLIAPVIDFLAGFLGLGALPDRIADTIRGFQEWVMGILDRVIRWLAERARALLQSLGLGPAQTEDQRTEDDGETIAEPVRMGDENHTLRIKTGAREVTLASDEGPLQQKLDAGLAKLHEYEGSPEAGEASTALRRMRTLLGQIFAALQAGTPVDRARLRDFSRQTKQVLEAYGAEFHVSDVVDGLPEFGPVVVGPHRVGAVAQPDGSTRESHHVPPKELAQALAREMRDTQATLQSSSQPAAAAAAADLDRRAGMIEANADGTGLSAISVHRVTHQNAGGVGIHAAAMREEIVQAIAGIDAASRQRTIQIRNRVSGDLAVNPGGTTFAEWLRDVQAALDAEDASAAEKASTLAAARQAGTSEAAENQAAAAAGRQAERQRLPRLVDRAFDSSLNQGQAAVAAALRHSVVDGPQEDINRELPKLDSEARSTWRTRGILPT
ncbi:MAG: DUF4157 domain-containing protein [Verrucomicrobiales bacterium]|nr:DUF4157 domain-containing protein [Verrucomicrobiales bacterium]